MPLPIVQKQLQPCTITSKVPSFASLSKSPRMIRTGHLRCLFVLYRNDVEKERHDLTPKKNTARVRDNGGVEVWTKATGIDE